MKFVHYRARIGAVATAAALALAGIVGVTTAASAADLGNIDFTRTDGSITVTKLTQPPTTETPTGEEDTSLPAGAEPIEGVNFELTPITGIDLTDPLQWDSLATATVDQVLAKGVGTVVPAVTAADGTLTFGSLTPGVYVVKELPSPGAKVAGESISITSHAAPWIVVIPSVGSDGTWNYNVHTYPKNSVTDLSKVAQQPSEYGLGSVVTWGISSMLPVLPSTELYTSFLLTDALDPRLEFTAVENVEYAGVALDPADWAVSANPATWIAGSPQTVSFTLTAAGLAKVQANQGKVLSFDLDTTVREVGTGVIENSIEQFTNNSNPTPGTGSKPPVTPKTNWGDIKIDKIDADTNEVLQGAKFSVYKTAADAQNKTNPIAVIPPGETTAVTVFESDSNGRIVIPGLWVGSDDDVTEQYFLREVEAPAGYTLLAAEIAVTVKAGEASGVDIMTITNTKQELPQLPLTGSTGTIIFVIAGVLLVGGGVLLSLRNRSRNTSNK